MKKILKLGDMVDNEGLGEVIYNLADESILDYHNELIAAKAEGKITEAQMETLDQFLSVASNYGKWLIKGQDVLLDIYEKNFKDNF